MYYCTNTFRDSLGPVLAGILVDNVGFQWCMTIIGVVPIVLVSGCCFITASIRDFSQFTFLLTRRDYFICSITLPADLTSWDLKTKREFCLLLLGNYIILISTKLIEKK